MNKKTQTDTKMDSKSAPKSSMMKKFNLTPVFVAQTLLVVILGIAVFLLAQKYRGFVIAGIVNKTPITRWELNQTLTNRYGKAVLDELIAERLLKEQAVQNQIQVSDQEVTDKIAELKDKFGGEDSFQQALVQYGLTPADLNDQVYLSLLQEKLGQKLFDINVTDEEVQQYFDDNSQYFEGQSLDDVKDDIKTQLLSQKLEQEFSTWFSDIRAKAQIQTYID